MGGILRGCAGATYTVFSAAEVKGGGGGGKVAEDEGPVAHLAGVNGVLFGNALLVLQCVGGAIFQLINKQLTGRYPSITVAAYGYCLGTLMLLLVVLPLRATTTGVWQQPLFFPACGALAYAVFLASAFNYFAYAWAARRSSASHVTAFFPMQVVFAAILQVLILGEWPTPAQLGGAAAIVVALFCIVASLAYDSGAGPPKAPSEETAAVVTADG